MSCHNRKEETINCLTSLFNQKLYPDNLFDVYLVDDGSTDGTSIEVKERYPTINIIEDTGSLFWGGGMRLAWTVAMRMNYDYYFWLNDDVVLFEDSISKLIMSALELKENDKHFGILVGSTCDPSNRKLTYGGFNDINGKSRLVPNNSAQLCLTFNGNIVIVTKEVFLKIGNISSDFKHSGGDMDYGLRAKGVGFNSYIAAGFSGYCVNHINQDWHNPGISFIKRWKHLHSPKGQPPKEVYIYAKRHGKFWFSALLKNYLNMFFPTLYFKIKRLKEKL